jgi:hypothetical protein
MAAVVTQNTFGSDVVNSAERVGLYLSNLLERMNVTSELVVETENVSISGSSSLKCVEHRGLAKISTSI